MGLAIRGRWALSITEHGDDDDQRDDDEDDQQHKNDEHLNRAKSHALPLVLTFVDQEHDDGNGATEQEEEPQQEQDDHAQTIGEHHPLMPMAQVALGNA